MKIPTIIPRGKQVLVKPNDAESRVSEHGIISPDNEEQETKAIGTVIAVGPEIKDIKEGNKVIYGAFAGEQISFKESTEEVDFVLLFDEDVLAFIKD